MLQFVIGVIGCDFNWLDWSEKLLLSEIGWETADVFFVYGGGLQDLEGRLAGVLDVFLEERRLE